MRLGVQGVRPAALQKVRSQELAEFIAVCIRSRNERPRARQLLKAPYFDSIRERCTARSDALSASMSQVWRCFLSPSCTAPRYNATMSMAMH